MNGVFSYKLNYESDDPTSSGLAVIYGENGTGKSTFLHALYHLLSPGKRHALALAQLELAEISAQFSSGAAISYSSEIASDSPTLTISRPGADDLSLPINEYVSDRPLRESVKAREFYDALEAITIPVILVSDDRSVATGGVDTGRPRFPGEYLSISELRDLSASGELMSRMRSQEIEGAVNRAEDTLRRSAMRGMSRGGTNTQSLYVDLVKQLEADRSLLNAADARHALELKLEEVSAIGKDYIGYGLVALDQVQAISQEISGLRYNAASLPLIHRVVGPYVDSLLVHMDALREARDFIDAYVSAVNSFISRKTFRYDLEGGASITLDHSGKVVQLAALSSGEKHLLLLLSYAVVAREEQGLIIIDEPELSLGLDWRRKLIPALLRCADPSRAQFLLASHAVEIVAEYEKQVVNPTEARV
ncbi:MAG: AAA family ATPase [Georgenia sp.]